MWFSAGTPSGRGACLQIIWSAHVLYIRVTVHSETELFLVLKVTACYNA